jgi:hypothetical protein
LPAVPWLFSGDFAGTGGKFLQKSSCMDDEKAYNSSVVWRQWNRRILYMKYERQGTKMRA